jgi:hypothetical protein
MSVRLHHRVAFSLVALVLLLLLAILPFAIDSIVGNLIRPDTNKDFFITAPDTPSGYSYSRIRIRLLSLDEWSGVVTLLVSGVHVCEPACYLDDKYLFVSVPLDQKLQDGLLPLSQSVSFPANSNETVQQFTLPVYGDSLRFPFDTYRLRLGVIMQRVFPDGTTTTLTPDDAYGHLYLTVIPHVARTSMDTPSVVDPDSVRPWRTNLQYVSVSDLVLERPLYVRAMTVLLVLLVSAAASYAVFLRPLNELVVNAGALVLGVWGIRAILLGTNVPGLTAVDLALSTVILFLLAAITVRAFHFLSAKNSIRWSTLIPRNSGEAKTDATIQEGERQTSASD